MKMKLLHRHLFSLLFSSFLAVGCLVLVGCKATVPAATVKELRDSTTHKKDSSWFVLEVDADTVYLPGDTVRIGFVIECDSVTNKPIDANAIVEGKTGRLVISLKNGLLNIMSQRDSMALVIETNNKIIHHLKNEITRIEKDKSESNPIEIYKTHWYDIAARWMAVILILIILITLLLKLKKPI